MAAQAAGAPHREVRADWKLPLVGCRGSKQLVSHQWIGVRRQRPGLTRLLMAGQAQDIASFGEGAARRRLLLEAVNAQKLRRPLERIGLAQVRIVAGGTLHLPRFQWQPGLDAGRTRAHGGAVGRTQLPVTNRQRSVVSEGDRVVVGEIDAEIARKAGGRPGTGGHRAARSGAVQCDRLVGLAAQHVDVAQRQRAVVARQAQLAAAAGAGRQLGRVRLNRAGGVRRVGGARKLAVPQRRGGDAFGPVRGVAEHADLRLAGRLDGARAADRQIVPGIGNVGDLGRAHRSHRHQRSQRSEQTHNKQ